MLWRSYRIINIFGIQSQNWYSNKYEKILVYGDSDVWGYTKGGIRLPEKFQWPLILEQLLGASNYKVIQEGLPGRTAGDLDQEDPGLNGQAPFEVIVRSSVPLDIIMVALGTNDLKPLYDQTVQDITTSLLWYRDTSNRLAVDAHFIFVLPANFAYKEGGMQDELRQEVIASMRLATDDDKYILLDAIDLSADGVHFTPKGQSQVADLVRNHLTEFY